MKINLLAALAVLGPTAVLAQDAPTGDAAAGEEHFNRQCIACHVVQDEAGEVLAGLRPAHRPPAQGAQIERERRAGEAGPRAAADDPDAPVGRGRSGRRGTLLGWPRERPPPRPVVEERRAERCAIGSVSPDDDHATAPRGCRRMVDRDGEVGQPLPAVASRVIGVHPP